MQTPNFIILYVDNPPVSAKFYESVLGKPPVESSPTFVMFALGAGLMLGLWERATVKPAAPAPGVGGEIAITVDKPATVDAIHADWRGRGIIIAQPPTDLDFGRAFTALDPDGHRLRVFAPPAA